MDIEEKEVEITQDIMKNLAMGKVFKDNMKEINSIDFSKDGTRIITSDDTTLNLYDVE